MTRAAWLAEWATYLSRNEAANAAYADNFAPCSRCGEPRWSHDLGWQVGRTGRHRWQEDS